MISQRRTAKGPALRPAGRERGQGIIEFALLFPLFVIFAFVIFDFAVALDRREVLDHAMREGTRTASLGQSVAVIEQATVDASEGYLDMDDVSVCYQDAGSNGQADDVGDSVQVSVTHAYRFFLGGELLNALGLSDPSITMSETSDARLETEVIEAPPC